MIRIIIKLFTQALLLIGPIITLNWSFLSFLGYGDPVDINLRVFHIIGAKPAVELNLRLVATAAGWFLVAVSEVFDYYIPRRDFREFRSLYLNNDALQRWRGVLHSDIRINIMHTHRKWYFLGLVRMFHWTWNDKFDPPEGHFDVNLRLTEFQGVCGKAFREQLPQFVDFRPVVGTPLRWYEKWLLLNQFHLWHKQIVKVGHVKAILSIPILREMKGNSPKWKPAGVINLDTTTDEGAEFLKINKQKLVDYFTDYGKMLACLK